VQRLAHDLQGRGKDVWVDVEGIRDADVFPVALRRAIESSDAFVFVISPELVRSEFCEQEVAYASESNKRIVPLSLREVPDKEIPEQIRVRTWIPAGEDSGIGAFCRAGRTWRRRSGGSRPGRTSIRDQPRSSRSTCWRPGPRPPAASGRLSAPVWGSPRSRSAC
jgi:TIR domain